jgi:1,4-alpha-glucan branching enzyme
MKKILILFLSIIYTQLVTAQLLVWTPDFAKDNDNIAITVDATKGNLGLQGFTGNVYVHIGVITSASTSPADWKYTKFTWGTTNAAALATPAGTNKWTYTITGGIRAFFGVPPGETILRIAILYRDGAGSLVQRNADGSDMYVPVYSTNLAARFTIPLMQPFYNLIPEPISKGVGDQLPCTAIANGTCNLRILLNGVAVQTATNATTISASPGLTTTGSNKLLVEATQGVTVFKDSFLFFVAPAPTVAALPAGVIEGINYNPNNTEATLVLFAPNKNRVSIIGEFAGSNWNETLTYQMNKTPDGKYWWLKLTGLTPGTEYAYQYLVDGVIKIGDPYAQKILDPNDQYILTTTYPGLKPYPVGQNGIVSVLQTNEPSYVWAVPNFTRPNKKALVIYELLVRDFVANHDFKTVKDSLNYLKNLGVNAIQVMPFNEFEGNESWGYNPDYYFAPDKNYGPKTSVKEFIDAAHSNGIAVIMDMTMNHVFGSAPQAKLYWDAANNQPAANNPWLNQVAPHPFSVGNDFNHTKDETKYLVDRVIDHWLTEYKIDGFRWDLSKGFTQRNCGTDVNCWNQYDIDRINIWKRIYDVMQTKSPNSYCILEHLAGNDEEKELANYGMLLWGKMTDPYNQVSMGYVDQSDIGGVIHTQRGWPQPHLVGYAESHDEERTMFKNVTYGNQSGANGYNVRLLSTALRREELIAALLLTVPGPKMFWQFAELGYDYTINYCTNATINPNCRTDKKPIRWDYFSNTDRRRLYDIYASLNNLRKLKQNAFANGSVQWGTGGIIKWITVNDASLKLVVISNMDVNTQSGTVTFPTSGTYYDYLLGGTFTATGGSQSFTLAPGEYHVYIDQNINGAVFTSLVNPLNPVKDMRVLVYPNPIVNDALIEYDLPENANVEIKVRDLKGQDLGTIRKGFYVKGTHDVHFKTNGMIGKKPASGMYFLEFTVNKKKRTEKIYIQ